MILLKNDWCIDVTKDCYVLQKDTKTIGITKDGKNFVIYQNHTCHGTLYQALRKYQHNLIVEDLKDRDITLDEMVEYYKEQETWFWEFIEDIKNVK